MSALVVSGTDLFVGRSFTQAWGLGAEYIALWNGSALQALGSGVSGTVSALAVPNPDTADAGRNFGSAGGKVSSHIAYYGPEPLIVHDGFE